MTVKFFATYREITGCKETAVTAPEDVLALLNNLSGQYGAALRKKLMTPDGNDIGEETIILVNGRNAEFIDGVRTTLSDGDVVSVFPMVAGG